jgi:integrase
MKKNENTLLIERKGSFYLRKNIKGKQREISFGKNLKIAKQRERRFLDTLESTGYEAAMQELRGKPCLKAGTNPTFEQISLLYRDYCQQAAKPPRPTTINHNLSRLGCIMNRCDIKTVNHIDRRELKKKWFGDKIPTDSNNRTFTSAVKAAASIFKDSALAYYETRKITLKNPFHGMELNNPKVSQYVPISSDLRKKIWNECTSELSPHDAMIILMALGIGMRRSEIEGAIPSWFSIQDDRVIVQIKREKHFTPKNGENGSVPFKKELYEKLIELRGESDSKFFVPTNDSTNRTTGRIWDRVRVVNRWLKSKGLDDGKPLHALRKECGSLIAKTQGILEASKILRNTLAVASVHYAGISEVSIVDIGATMKKSTKDPLAEAAKLLGVSIEELLKLKKITGG